jgi:hypothetical protein
MIDQRTPIMRQLQRQRELWELRGLHDDGGTEQPFDYWNPFVYAGSARQSDRIPAPPAAHGDYGAGESPDREISPHVRAGCGAAAGREATHTDFDFAQQQASSVAVCCLRARCRAPACFSLSTHLWVRNAANQQVAEPITPPPLPEALTCFSNKHARMLIASEDYM